MLLSYLLSLFLLPPHLLHNFHSASLHSGLKQPQQLTNNSAQTYNENLSITRKPDMKQEFKKEMVMHVSYDEDFTSAIQIGGFAPSPMKDRSSLFPHVIHRTNSAENISVVVENLALPFDLPQVCDARSISPCSFFFVTK